MRNLRLLLNNLFFACILLCVAPVYADCSFTRDYLERYKLGALVLQYFRSYYEGDFEKNEPYFDYIISKETDIQCFGYHASSNKYRLCQDVLRAIFEETLGYNDIPEDFYFLRVPGLKDFDLPQGKHSFIEMFGRKDTPDVLDPLCDAIILFPIQTQLRLNLRITDFNEDEKKQMHSVLLSLVEYIDYLHYEVDPSLDTYLKGFQQDEASIKAFSSDITIKISEEQKKIIEQNPRELKSFQFYNHLIEADKSIQEKKNKKKLLTVIPYNSNVAAETLFNLFVTVIKRKSISPSEDKIRSWLLQNMQFSQLIAHCYNAKYCGKIADVILNRFLEPYNDCTPGQQKRVVAMNIPLYGNYFRSDETSVGIFLKGQCIEGGDYWFSSALKELFSVLNINEIHVNKMLQVGGVELARQQNLVESRLGVLFQFYVKPGCSYEWVDNNAYVSADFGYFVKEVQPSDVFMGKFPIRRKKIDIQLRLIMSNNGVLNPYSPLGMHRYDGLSAEASQAIIDRMKQYLRNNVKADTGKVDAYKNKLNKVWKAEEKCIY